VHLSCRRRIVPGLMCVLSIALVASCGARR
jgi:hypothetical protein